MIVEDVLKKWPQTYSVFQSWKADCIGCLLQRFCTLQDVAESYAIDLTDLIKDLENCVTGNYDNKRSIQ